MANNLIQIKRSTNTQTPPSLAQGELAFTANDSHLFIGSPNGSILPIGGFYNYGVLTANQALVANSTGFIDAVKTANLTVRSITANGNHSPGAGYLLSVDAGGNTFWLPQSSVSINTASQFSWTNTHQFSANVTITGTAGLIANGSIGSANQVLRSNGSSIYWSTDDGDISGVTAGNGLTGGGTSGAVTVSVLANNGVVSNSTGVFVNANNGLSTNSTGLFVVGGDGLVSNATGVHIGAGNGVTVTTDAIAVNGGSTLTVNASGVHVNSALSITDLSLSGNLTVLGTLTTLDTTNLIIEDPMIELANGNVTTDLLDIGFFGQYGSSGTKYTGLFRDATNGIYRLFTGSSVEPTTTVDTAAAGYTIAQLQTYLTSSALTTNATAVAITANSTVNVAITANNLAWSGLAQNGIIYGGTSGAFTNLSAGNGGTILMVSTAGVPEFATLDGGSF
jgi:hypothetical protein